MTPPDEKSEIFSTAWGIMFGCMDRNGRRIIPGRGDRKRMGIRFGIDPSLKNWRRWAAEDPKTTSTTPPAPVAEEVRG